MLTVQKLRHPQSLRLLHSLLRDWFDPSVQCRPGSTWPDAQTVLNAAHVYAAYDGDTPVVLMLVRDDGYVRWLNGRPDAIAEGCASIAAVAGPELGAFFGAITNDALRNSILSQPGISGDPGTRRVYWVGT